MRAIWFELIGLSLAWILVTDLNLLFVRFFKYKLGVKRVMI
jgi:hypothetical protein